MNITDGAIAVHRSAVGSLRFSTVRVFVSLNIHAAVEVMCWAEWVMGRVPFLLDDF